jgi:hypothetical protein
MYARLSHHVYLASIKYLIVDLKKIANIYLVQQITI